MGTESRLKTGIFFNARPEQGGLYQYALALIESLNQFAPEFDYRLYNAGLEAVPLQGFRENWQVVNLPRRAVLARMAVEMALMQAARFGAGAPFPVIPAYRQIQRDPPDVMIYVKPTPYVFQWPYRAVFPIHDLQHRLQPEFPEVSHKGEYRRREYIYTRSIPRAAAVLTDSETGKEDVLACYSADASRIYPLPYIAPSIQRQAPDPAALAAVRQKYQIPEGFLIYPAAFWTHKNHLRLVKAVELVREQKGASIPLVLTGGKRHNYEQVAALVSQLGLQDTILFLGYVPDEDLRALYRQAIALVMPTFFGPTNIPVLEAWAAGCAVITSDLRGIREQVGGAGLLVDPRDEAALAEAVWRVYTDAGLRQELIEKGRIRAAQWTPELFARRLAEVIKTACTR